MKHPSLFKKENSKIRCLACHHKCLISEGKVGLCGVRKNHRGKLQLLTYGKIAAHNIDPIEKKPLYHFLPGSKIYSIGTVGCNFHCGFCQNWSISQVKESREIFFGREIPPEKIAAQAKPFPSIAYTYNEPTVFFEFARDIASIAKDKKHVFVSNGYFSDEALAQMQFIDAINIDLKSFSEAFYRKNCGAKLQPVLDNIRKCKEKGIWVEVTTLLIPGENNSEEELKKIAQFIASVDKEIPWHISAFHPDYKMLNPKSTSFSDLKRAYDIAKEEGLSFVYLGNVHSIEHNSTFCPKCRKLLIRRDNYHISIEGLSLVGPKAGTCRNCGLKIPGVWK